MSKRKTPAKPLSAEQIAARDPFADGAAPALGGAWVRKADGTLVRDRDTEQHVPEGEEAGAPEQLGPQIVPPPPAGPGAAGVTDTESQEA